MDAAQVYSGWCLLNPWCHINMADHGTASIPYMTYTSILNEVFVWMNGHADIFTCYIFITDYTDGSFMAIQSLISSVLTNHQPGGSQVQSFLPLILFIFILNTKSVYTITLTVYVILVHISLLCVTLATNCSNPSLLYLALTLNTHGNEHSSVGTVIYLQ